MDIGRRLSALREQKRLSQRDIEGRAGINRCYISRIENGHLVPSVETLERIARALRVPMYQLFIGGEEKQNPVLQALRDAVEGKSFGIRHKEERHFIRLWRLLSNMTNSDRKVLLTVAFALANRKK